MAAHLIRYPSRFLAMKALRVLALAPLWFALVAATPSPSPTPTPSPPPPSPTPCPTPVNANISLSPAAGEATVKITANGASFCPNQQISLYWDNRDHVAGSVTADPQGNFAKPNLTPFPGDKPGVHRLCASVLPNPCANFTLQGPPSPTPRISPPPSPTPSPSPSPSESPTPIPLPIDSAPTALDIITKPPFVFFPIIALLGIIGAIAYWALSAVNVRRTPPNLPTASVVHRSARPDMGPVNPPAAPQQPMPPPPPGGGEDAPPPSPPAP